MIKTDNEFVYDSLMPPLMDLPPPPLHESPGVMQQGDFPPHFFQQHSQAQQIRQQQQHYMRMRQEQQQREQLMRKQHLMRQEQLRRQQQQQQRQNTFHQTAFRSSLPQFQRQTGWQRAPAPLMRVAPRGQLHPQRPLVIIQKRPPLSWTLPVRLPPAPPTPPQFLPTIDLVDDFAPPLLECELPPLSVEQFNPPLGDDFKDFDVTDLLRLSFDDDERGRKRKSHTVMYGSHMIKRRRTKAEMIADRNRELMRQCRECSVSCEPLQTPSHVRLFGDNGVIRRGDMPNVPTMKLTPKTVDFNRVRSIGYLVTKKGVCFSCLGECKFKSYDRERFREHLAKFHHTADECGSSENYCELCRKNCCGYSVIDELIHIVKHHVKSVDDHPMHQILFSHVMRTIKKEEEPIIALDSPLMVDSEEDLDEIPVGNRSRVVLTDYEDDDYHPSSSDDEEVESEGDVEEEKLLASSEESEAKSTSSSSGEEEEEESDSEDEEEHRKRRPRSNNSDDIPHYVLERIKQNSSIKCDESEIARTYNEDFAEAIEQLISEEVPKSRKKKKKKKEKKKQLKFARKSTSRCDSPFRTYTVTAAESLPPCRVVLTRCEVENQNIVRESLKMIIRRTDKDKQIAVPDIPTPPSSEDSRDSLSTPPLNKTAPARVAESTSRTNSPFTDGRESKSADDKTNVHTNEDSSSKVEEEKVSMEPEREESEKLSEITNEIDEGEKCSEKVSVQNEIEMREETDEVIELDSSPRKDLNEGPRIQIQSVEILNLPIDNISLDNSLEIIETSPQDKEAILEDSKNETDEISNTKVSEERAEEQIIIDSQENSPTIKIHDSPILIDAETPEVIELSDDTPVRCSTPTKLDRARGLVSSIKNYFSRNKTESGESSAAPQVENAESEDPSDLVSLAEVYPWINSFTTSSIFKTKQCIREWRSEFCQFSTYKCMEKSCSYFTVDFQKFKTHAGTHGGDQHFCSFCLHNATGSDELCEHIEKLHTHDRYQCNLCMYRASEKMYVDWHQQRFHKERKGKILKSPVQALMKSVRNRIQSKLKNVNREKFVQPYKCEIEDCKRVFYCKENYRQHLAAESQKPNMAQFCDIICKELTKLDQTRFKDAERGIHQCLYCAFGTDSKNEIQEHMTDVHPHKLGFVCRRKLSAEIEPDSARETLENATVIEYIGHSSFKVKFYTDDRAKLTKSTSENLQDTIVLVEDDAPDELSSIPIIHLDGT